MTTSFSNLSSLSILIYHFTLQKCRKINNIKYQNLLDTYLNNKL